MAILTENEKQNIADAVEKAEQQTGAEIVTAVIRESDDYGFQETVFSVTAAFITYNLAVYFGSHLENILSGYFWNFDSRTLPYFYGFISLLAGGFFYFLAQIPAIDRLIISRRKMTVAVNRRAQLHFLDSGVSDTIERTGILIFVSTLEKQAVIIADRGINDKVQQDTWSTIVNQLTKDISIHGIAPAIISAVSSCGEILGTHIDKRRDDTNELNNHPEELGR